MTLATAYTLRPTWFSPQISKNFDKVSVIDRKSLMFLICWPNWNKFKTDNNSVYRFLRLLQKTCDWSRGICGVILVSEFIFIWLPTLKIDKYTFQFWKRHFTSLICKWNLQGINLRKTLFVTFPKICHFRPTKFRPIR